MAAAGEHGNTEDDLTVCSICLERFNKPKYLPCLHTFCEACLSKYITSAYEPKESEQGFLCPTCRTFTEASSKDFPPEKWAENFPLNHLIVSLIDREKSRETGKLCDICTRGNTQTKAEHWCQNCSEALCQACQKYHLIQKFNIDHVVISLKDLHKDGEVFPDPDIFCNHHKNKKLEIYCYDHETPCCVICMTVHHRSCHKVNTLEEATKEIINSPELQSLQESFLEIRQQLQDTVDGRRKAGGKMEKSKLEMEKKITEERKRIDAHLDILENKLRQEVSTIHTEQSAIITEQRKILQDKTSIVENCIKVLKTCQTNKIRNVHILLELKQLKSKQKQLNEFYDSEVAKIKNVKLQLDITEDVSNLTSNIKSFGKTLIFSLDEDKQNLAVTPRYSFHTAVPQLMKSFKNSEKGNISSATFLPTGHILLVHWSRDNKVTLMDLNGKCISSLTLSGSPWDVTLVTPQQAVVTLPPQKQLVYINIDPSSLSLSVHKTVTLDGECRGICRVGQILLVTYPTQLNVLDLEGRITNTIKVRGRSRLYYVTEHKDNIYLSDYDQHCVVCIDSVGTEIFRYTSDNLRYPWKITADCEGNIYVAGCASHNIHQLTSDGKLIRILPVDVKSPTCLVFEENSNQFLVYSHGYGTCTLYTMK